VEKILIKGEIGGKGGKFALASEEEAIERKLARSVRRTTSFILLLLFFSYKMLVNYLTWHFGLYHPGFLI